MAKKNKKRENQLDAFERNMPKIFEIEDKVKISSSVLSDVKDWKVGEDYEVKMKINQLASRELRNGEIEAEFEIKEVKSI